MSEPTIYNCHMHVFTTQNVPRLLLKLQFGPVWGTLLSGLMRWNWTRRFCVRVARGVYPMFRHDAFQRLATMYSTGNLSSQEKVFQVIQKQYPAGTVFVALAMNLQHTGLGPVPQHVDKQHAELLALAQRSAGCLVPFYAADPREPGVVEKVHEALAPGKFRGVKIYPNLGYYPTDKTLMEVYAICQERDVPVMTHCSSGGMYHYGFKLADRMRYSQPENYAPVLKAFPNLRLCLAHFGGNDEWDKHLTNQTPRDGPRRAWIKWITDMLTSGDYPNLYTDISYLAFQARSNVLHIDYVDYLKVLLSNPLIGARVLFGSDYYAVEQELMTEKEVSITLRSHLGEALYFQIANENPRRYLGLP